MIKRHILLLTLVSSLLTSAAFAQGEGRIEGRILLDNGDSVGGVAVVVEGLALATVSDSRGAYSFDHVPVGTYTLSFTLGDRSATEDGVEVTAGRATQVESTVDWDVVFAETITVYSASRRTERITEAPAAITIIPEQQIEREATNGQLPKLLEFTPGAEVTQSGLYDFNFNTRGFNSSLNRRILTLIDGRDPSIPFLGNQEWAALSFPLDDVASLELVRGPGSALYGADAFNGVLNIVTKAPRYSQGGRFQLSGGDLDMRRGDLRWASSLGGNWFVKLTGGYQESDDFSVSRNVASGGPEYRPCSAALDRGCLTPEAIALVRPDDRIAFGGLRFDRYFESGQVLTLEGGWAEGNGPVAQTGIGRVQIVESKRPWARANLNTSHWNFLGYWNKREAPRQFSLRSGGLLALDSENYQFEVQGHVGFAGDKGRLVGGAYYKKEMIDSAGPDGRQTLMFAAKDEDFEGAFGQLDYSFTDKLKGILAGRVDDSSLHDTHFSPRGGLVYAFNPNHSLRLTYSEAFQVPNYSEFFLQAAVGPNLPFQALEGICAAAGVSCGFDQGLPILALGNANLDVETIHSVELGYRGIIDRKLFLTLDLYRNEYNNFVTDLIPRLNSTLGNINPDFGFYQPPAELPAPLAALLIGTLQAQLTAIANLGLTPTNFFPFLTNNFDGKPVIGFLSYVNFGKVEANGAELGLNYYVNDKWLLDLNYSYFDFSSQQELPEDPVLPNTAKNRFSVGVTYLGKRFDAGLKYRHTEAFQWNAGVFEGPVPAYGVANLTADYNFAGGWKVGLDVSNLFNDKHWEAFGGDILERRALVRLGYHW